MSTYLVSEAQFARLQEMKSKGYPVCSLRFDPHKGHVTVGVRVKRGVRYFFVSQQGHLK